MHNKVSKNIETETRCPVCLVGQGGQRVKEKEGKQRERKGKGETCRDDETQRKEVNCDCM